MRVYVSHSMDEGYFTYIEEAQEFHSGTVYHNSQFAHYGFAEIPQELYNRYIKMADDLDEIESEIIGIMQEQNTSNV